MGDLTNNLLGMQLAPEKQMSIKEKLRIQKAPVIKF